MPLKLNVGISKKVGLPHYGSLGTSCHVEVELDGGLIFYDLEGFHHQVRQAYVACAQAVQDELARLQGSATATAKPGEPLADASGPAAPRNRNGHGSDHRKQNGQQQGVKQNGKPSGPPHGCWDGASGGRASQRQLDYASQLAEQIPGLGVRQLEAFASQMYGQPLAGLSSLDASSLIDTLKAMRDGRLDRPAIFTGAST